MFRLSESTPVIPPENGVQVLTDVCTAIILGADVTHNYKNSDGVCVRMGGISWTISNQEYDIVRSVKEKIKPHLTTKSAVVSHSKSHSTNMVSENSDAINPVFHTKEAQENSEFVSFIFPSAYDAFIIRNQVLGLMKLEMDKLFTGVEKKIAMLKDKASSGWWRMVKPAESLESDRRILIDCTAAEMSFDNLLEYDTIMVQRVHDWNSYYIMKKLRKIGKKVVYDIDDNLFCITPDNPAYGLISRDDQLAAMACIKEADVVTVTTDVLGKSIQSITGVSCKVIPNSLELGKWKEARWSEDGYKRILWSGGASHAKDWEECFGAIMDIMRGRKDVRLMILGFLPPCIDNNRYSEELRGRIEYMGFKEPESYYETLGMIRAEVGLAPIGKTNFNSCKSAIKFLEYAVAGVPTVASDWSPYSDVIESGKDGFLAGNWQDLILRLLDNQKLRERMVKEARNKCMSRFDLRNNKSKWLEVLF